MTTTTISPKEIFKANQMLTLEIAKTLVGKTIATTNAEYRMNQSHVSVFTVGHIAAEWDYAESLPMDGFSNRQAYWASYMNPQQIEERKTTLILFGMDGSRYHVCHTKFWQIYNEPTFTGSDADREVYYIVLD